MLVEFGAYLYVKVNPRLLTRQEFRATQPPPYYGADYFSSGFINERSFRGSWELSDSSLLIPQDISGRYFNVKERIRITTDAPRNYENRILIFGGSTLYAAEVPDAYTVPSYLQRLINRQNLPYRVYNYGVPSMTATQELLRLRMTELRRDDIVIFFDGVNDITYHVFFDYEVGVTKGKETFKPIHKFSPFEQFLFSVHSKFSKRSYTVRLFFDVYDRSIPDTIRHETELKSSLLTARQKYFNALSQARDFTAKHSGHFFHFLQPSLFSKAHLSDYEQSLLKNYLQLPPGLDRAFALSLPIFREVVLELARSGTNSFDISRIVDQKPESEEWFLDYCHVNHQANKAIANGIFEKIEPHMDR